MEGKEFNLKIGLDQTLGLNGKSAYQIWLEAGNSGSEEDFLNSLKWNRGQHRIIIDLKPNWPGARQFLFGKEVVVEVGETVHRMPYVDGAMLIDVDPGQTVRITPPADPHFATPKTREITSKANQVDYVNFAYDATLVLCTCTRSVRPKQTESDGAVIPVSIVCGGVSESLSCSDTPVMTYLPKNAEATFTPEANATYSQGVKTVQMSEDALFVALKQESAWIHFESYSNMHGLPEMERVFAKIVNADTAAVIHDRVVVDNTIEEADSIPVPVNTNLKLEFEVPAGVRPIESQTLQGLSAGSINKVTVGITGGLIRIYANGLIGDAGYDIVYAEGDHEGEVYRSGKLSGQDNPFLFADFANFKIRFKPSESGLNPNPEEIRIDRKGEFDEYTGYVTYS